MRLRWALTAPCMSGNSVSPEMAWNSLQVVPDCRLLRGRHQPSAGCWAAGNGATVRRNQHGVLAAVPVVVKVMPGRVLGRVGVMGLDGQSRQQATPVVGLAGEEQGHEQAAGEIDAVGHPVLMLKFPQNLIILRVLSASRGREIVPGAMVQRF